MKSKASINKALFLSFATLAAATLSGCRVPTDETGAIKQITLNTTFQDVMSQENWFNAIFVWPMTQALNHLTPYIGVVGAIICLTITVNLILLALTLKSTIASQQMQFIQPEVERINRKYEGRTDDASKMKKAAEVQELYRKYNINPFSAIVVQFLQFPVIIAMYHAVQRSSAIKTGTFLGLSLEINPMQGLLQNHNVIYLFIFILMGLSQYLSMMIPQKLAQKRAERDALKHHTKVTPPSNTNKMMQYYMTIMILVFGLMFPTAMAIYWTINSLIMIGKTLFVHYLVSKKGDNI